MLADRGGAALSYAAGGGFAPLREWLAERHHVEPERVVLTNGSLQGFVLLAQLLLARRGPRVLVEAPTYDRPLQLLGAMGAEIVPVPLDGEGLDIDALEDAAAGSPAAFLYAIPTFQNPTGRTLGRARRERVVELAHRHGLFVLEDDPYGLVRFEGESPPTLLELDGGAGVGYSSSFSKTVAPGLRVGYLVLPAQLAGELERRAAETYISPAVVGQAILWEFLRRGRLEANVAAVSALLAERRDAMVDALEESRADLRFTRPDGGYFVWLELFPGAREAELVERARAAGVTVVAGSGFFHGDPPAPALRLAYSAVPPARIRAGIARLAALLPALTPA